MEQEFEPMYGKEISVFLKGSINIPRETHSKVRDGKKAYYFEPVMGVAGTVINDSRSFIRLSDARCYLERNPGPDNYMVAEVLYLNKDNIESIVFNEEKKEE